MTRILSLIKWCLLLGPPCAGLAQMPSPWRSFKLADGLPESACLTVTVSPQGKVLTRHLESPYISELDGYTVKTYPAPEDAFGRVWELPTGQMWMAGPQGLYEFREGTWIPHPVKEMADAVAIPRSFDCPLYPVPLQHR